MDLARRLAAFEQADLYVVITEAFCAGRTSLAVLEQVLAAGVKIVQLREKDLPDRELYELGLEFRRRTEAAGSLLIIDDRVDIALAAGADGVHLGQTDLPVAAARRIAPDLIIGASSHSLEEALVAQEAGAGYVNIGPIFPTATKPNAVVLGVEAIPRLTAHLTIPWSTMGGISSGNIAQVVALGARHPAVMSAVTAAADVTAAAWTLRKAITS
jgi:thiamine-phosphate pyrophosphorylase